jgi:hypothetical protein
MSLFCWGVIHEKNSGLKQYAPCIYFKAMAKGGVFMKRAKDSPKVKVNLTSRKNNSNVSSSVLKKPIFDTNYYYYYFTEVQQQRK